MKNFDNLWVEKYRPRTLQDMILPDDVRETITSYGRDIPHLLFTGKTGGGKTTLAQIIVKDILNCDYLYINASDENGIDTVRTKILGFAQTKSFDGGLKVVVLDEVDGFTKDGQKALRNLMETYADNTRFILTGNFNHKIIAALRSRCQSIAVSPGAYKDIVERCVKILKTENVKIPPTQVQSLKSLLKTNYPDLRKCINELQKSVIDGVLSIRDKRVSSELCSRIFSGIRDGDVLELRKYLIENDSLFDGDYEQLLTDLLNYYYDQPLEDVVKKQSILFMADHLYKIVHVTDREICFFACILQLEALLRD